MKRLAYVLIAGLLVMLAVVPVAAQEDGQGGIIVDATFGPSGPTTFNPLTCTDVSCSKLMQFMLPALIGVDPATAEIVPGAIGGVAADWEISEDGSTYTFSLREDFFWSDGTPVTAQNFEFTWDAITSGEVETRLVFLTDAIVDMVALDDYTLEVTFFEADCEALNGAGIRPLPSHLFTDTPFGDLEEVTFTEPGSIAIGPFQLAEYSQDQQTGIIPVEGGNFPDAIPGFINPTGYILRLLGDQTVHIEQFLAGQLSVIQFVPPDRRSDIRAAADDGRVVAYEYNPGDSYDYLALNFANPDNPQPALDENGELVEQDPHPIFGDVRVRQALAHAVDMDAVIQGAVFGEGSRMHSSYAQGTWPYNPDVSFYEFDPELALEMLNEAGWVDHDDNPTTPLIADGAMFAEDGTEFRFELLTNEGNTRRTALGTIVQDQLGQIGVAVDFQTIDFNVLLERLDNQNFDTFILGWRNSYPFRADQTQLFSATSDIIGGDNFTSYVNPEFDALMGEARTVPGCDREDRAEIYGQIQEIFNRDLPYIPLYSINGFYAAQANVEGFEPFPANMFWNITEWSVTP